MDKINICGIDHLGIVVKDITKAKWFFGNILNLQFQGSEVIERENISVDFYETTENNPLDSPRPRLELLESLNEKSVICRYKKKFGGGIHHLALRVKKIEEIFNLLVEKNIKILSSKVLRGAHGSKIIFVHPESTGGILIELVEKK